MMLFIFVAKLYLLKYKTLSMKSYFALLFLLFGTLAVRSQVAGPEYDSTLAGRLGADELGMKTYILVILKTGPAIIEDNVLRDSLFKGHFSNMDRLAAEKKLVAAGPFYTNEKQYRGLFLFDVDSITEAEELVKSDPTVIHGIFETEMYRWYGSAALPLLLEIHPSLVKKKH